MARKKISELPETTTINDVDYLPIVQDGDTKKITQSNYFSNILSQKAEAYKVPQADSRGHIDPGWLPLHPHGIIVPPGDNPGACLGTCPPEYLPDGMTPLTGYSDPDSDNFGNYQFSDGSVMCFIPKFFYRINNSENDAYAVYAPNDIHIVGADTFSSRSAAAVVGYALHRAFIDGGVEQPGFFFDKYMCSKNALGTGYVASSIKGGLPISIHADHNPIADLTACTTNAYYECVTAAHARDGADGAVNSDSRFFAITQFMGSALAMLALAHGQACTSTAHCAWFGATHNYPKGCNDNALSDVDDATVSYTSDGYSNCGKTGSGEPFAKTTHNGQACGIADLNGALYEFRLGLTRPGDSASDSSDQNDATAFYVLKEDVRACELTAAWNAGDTGSKAAWGDAAHLATLYDAITLGHIAPDGVGTRYGNGSNQVLDESTSGDGYKITGLGLPKDSNAKSSGGTDLFGNDRCHEKHVANLCMLSCSGWNSAASAGVFACLLHVYRTYSSSAVGFRCACYPEKAA
jgi:hypothetical protein